MAANEGLSLTLEAYQKIKDYIIRLNLKPGELIIVQHLAAKMNISRTPVREALTMLTKDALVEKAEGNKFRVTEITEESITELYRLRKLLECFAVKESLRQYTQNDFSYLEENTNAYETALLNKDFANFFALDLQFHQYFFKKLANKTLNAFIEQLNDKQQRIRFATLYIENRPNLSVQEHRRILSALENRDCDEFENQLYLHLSQVENDMLKNVLSQRKILNSELNYSYGIFTTGIRIE